MSALDLDLVNLTRLVPWLEQALPNFRPPVEVAKIAGGQSNPTFRLITPNKSWVLRRKPAGVLLKSAHAVDREFRVQRALVDTAVPVAPVHVYCADDSVIGSPFYVMDFLDGCTYDDPSLPNLSYDERARIMDEMNRVLADIHNVDLNQVGLDDYGPAGNYYQRQADRWTKQYRATETDPIPDMDDLIVWLEHNLPADDGQRTLVHGDYRLDNLMFGRDNGQCLAVLDWELSTTGHPYADLAAVIMQWAMPADTDGRGLRGIDRTAMGLMSDQEFIDRYCARRNIAGIDRFGFYIAFCFFRMAAILQGVKKRALDGNASDPSRGLRLGAYVPEMAKLGLAAAKGV